MFWCCASDFCLNRVGVPNRFLSGLSRTTPSVPPGSTDLVEQHLSSKKYLPYHRASQCSLARVAAYQLVVALARWNYFSFESVRCHQLNKSDGRVTRVPDCQIAN